MITPRFLRILALVLFSAHSLAAQATRFDDFQRLKGEGKLGQAVQVLRDEIADPGFILSMGSQPVYIRQHFLLALGSLAARQGPKPEFDAEALQVYREGLEKHARDNAELRALLANGIALYYSNSYRNGQALPYFRLELEHWERLGNKFRVLLTHDALASAYWDMGEFELNRHYMERVLDAASGYFVLGERPSDLNEWVQYWTMLGKYMDNAGQVGDIALLDRLWKLQEPIEPRYWGNGGLTAYTAAQLFAFAGQADRARAMLAKADELWVQMRARATPRVRELGDVSKLCSIAMVNVALRQYAEAVPLMENCLKGQEAVGVKEHEANFKQKLGLAYEKSGATDKAIDAYRASVASTESTRASYSVAERARFFRSFLRLPYWGLARIQAGRAGSDEQAFFEALHTSELVRGRQLGELIDPEMSKRISPESMRALQKRLAPDTAVVAYTATESELILLAMTRDRVLAAATPYDAKAFTALVRSTAADLSRPTSDLPGIEGRLLRISQTVLGNARPLLAGKKRIIALPDGILNALPFELLSSADDVYRPLIGEYIVTASPSLVFIEAAERQRQSSSGNLLAIADPVYGAPDTLAGVSLDEVRTATRGSRFLSYFEPLPETRSEAEAISKMFSGQKVQLLTGDQALESRVKQADLGQFGFLHFATHGILGNEVPGVGEPALVMGREPNEDGFLTASEVGQLKLNASLAVLSACNTGSGEFVTGEGVMGMSRAFLAAGSRSVVVSLWPVASKQTERLMVEFYRQLRSGLPAAEALRAAKLGALNQARKAKSNEVHPFFWAPFLLLGN
jgi:CHAT domain-containing protein/tetratricopeptide (TPR) repeat protein